MDDIAIQQNLVPKRLPNSLDKISDIKGISSLLVSCSQLNVTLFKGSWNDKGPSLANLHSYLIRAKKV